MNPPDCPDHGRLVLDLARGRLDDRRAEEAETVRRDCAACARWWDSTFDDETVTGLDSAVAETFGGFVPPRRRQIGWLAAAAAVVLAVGLSWIAQVRNDLETPLSVVTPAPTIGPALSTLDFENHNPESLAASPDDTPDTGNSAVFGSGFESGSLSSWSSQG
jgi:hypothetical protein